MKDARGATGGGPLVCPFVALLEDRDRRADGPDPRNRCYASPAPRQRDVAYQAQYCYSDRFSTCGTFLDWAARNAAEPSYPVPGMPGTSAREAPGPPAGPSQGGGASAWAFGPPPPDAGIGAGPAPEPQAPSATPSDAPSARGDPEPAVSMDWVSASAWAAFPTAPIEEPEEPAEETLPVEGEPDPADRSEATTAPKVPAALPMRRRRRALEPIRTRGSGEWFYSDPPDREPLVRRRFAAVPPVVLGAVGLIVVALVVLIIPSLLPGGGGPRTADGASPAPSVRRAATPRPAVRTPDATVAPTPEPVRAERTYRVRSGDSLSRIAVRFDVAVELIQCRNLIRNPNLITVGQAITIPPEGYACAPGWRRAQQRPEASPDVAEAGPDDGGSSPAP